MIPYFIYALCTPYIYKYNAKDVRIMSLRFKSLLNIGKFTNMHLIMCLCINHLLFMQFFVLYL